MVDVRSIFSPGRLRLPAVFLFPTVDVVGVFFLLLYLGRLLCSLIALPVRVCECSVCMCVCECVIARV